jgi:hypothetical protein
VGGSTKEESAMQAAIPVAFRGAAMLKGRPAEAAKQIIESKQPVSEKGGEPTTQRTSPSPLPETPATIETARPAPAPVSEQPEISPVAGGKPAGEATTKSELEKTDVSGNMQSMADETAARDNIAPQNTAEAGIRANDSERDSILKSLKYDTTNDTHIKLYKDIENWFNKNTDRVTNFNKARKISFKSQFGSARLPLADKIRANLMEKVRVVQGGEFKRSYPDNPQEFIQKATSDIYRNTLTRKQEELVRQKAADLGILAELNNAIESKKAEWDNIKAESIAKGKAEAAAVKKYITENPNDETLKGMGEEIATDLGYDWINLTTENRRVLLADETFTAKKPDTGELYITAEEGWLNKTKEERQTNIETDMRDYEFEIQQQKEVEEKAQEREDRYWQIKDWRGQAEEALNKRGWDATGTGSNLSEAEYINGIIYYIDSNGKKDSQEIKIRFADHEAKPTYEAMYGSADAEIGNHSMVSASPKTTEEMLKYIDDFAKRTEKRLTGEKGKIITDEQYNDDSFNPPAPKEGGKSSPSPVSQDALSGDMKSGNIQSMADETAARDNIAPQNTAEAGKGTKLEDIAASDSGKRVLGSMQQSSPEFLEWMKNKTGNDFTNWRLSTYTDGEPYFKHIGFGTEVTERDYTARKESVEKLLKKKQTVAPRVLAEFPDLAEKYKSSFNQSASIEGGQSPPAEKQQPAKAGEGVKAAETLEQGREQALQAIREQAQRPISEQERNPQLRVIPLEEKPPEIPPTAKVESIAPQPESPKTSGIAKSIEAKAIEKGLTDKGYDKLAGYDSSTIKKQAEMASKYDIEQIKRIATGKESLPEGMKPATPLSIAEDHAMETKDGQLALDLARSPLATQISESASEVSLSRMRTPDSASAKIKEVHRELEKAAEKKLKGRTPDKVKAEIKKGITEKIARSKPNKYDLMKLLDMIVC